jgi:hypothetical protein
MDRAVLVISVTFMAASLVLTGSSYFADGGVVKELDS